MKKIPTAFTLVELVVIIVMLGVVITVGFKSLQYYQKINHKIALEQAATWLQYLRQMANHTCELNLGGSDALWVASVTTDCQKDLKLEHALKDTFHLKYAIDVTPRFPLRINAQGFFDTNGQLITKVILMDSEKQALSISLDGVSGLYAK